MSDAANDKVVAALEYITDRWEGIVERLDHALPSGAAAHRLQGAAVAAVAMGAVMLVREQTCVAAQS